MTKPFTTPFAENGDVMFIPETAQSDGSVSYETGFGPDYSADPLEANAKPVPRAGHNELFNQITGSIGDIQRQGAADWYLEFAADGGYPKNAIVWLDGDRWKSQVDGNTTRPNIDEIAWLPSAKFEGGGSGGGGDFGLTGPTTIAVGGSFQYKISPYSSFMTYAVSATNGTATISGDTITLTIAPGETANVTDLTVVRSDGARNDFRIAIGAQSIAKPSMLSPASGSVDVPLGPLLTASAFMTYPDGADTHLNTDWRIRTMAGAVVWQSLANPTNKTNIQVPDNTLPLNTQLQADVRYRGATLPVSAWSDTVTFTTTSQSILTPTITAPLNGATGIGATPAFTSTAFATNPLGADTHASSDWQLKNSLGVVIWSSVADVVNKTSITLPSGVLAVSSQYTMEVRYNGNVLQPSQWSPVVSFTTAAQFSYEKYLAVGIAGNIRVYGQDIDTFTLLPELPAIAGQVRGTSWTPDGSYLAIAHDSGTFISVFKRTGDSFAQVSVPNLPVSSCLNVAWSPDGIYLAVASTSGANVLMYKRSGDNFTRLSISALSSGDVYSVSWGVNGNYVVFGALSTPTTMVYQRTGDSFNKAPISGIAGTPQLSANNSSDGGYMITSGPSGGRIYKVNSGGSSFSQLALLDIPYNATSYASAFSLGATHAVLGLSVAPFLDTYKRSGDTFTKQAALASPPPGTVRGLAFSQDGIYLAVAHDVTPFISIYKKSGDLFTKLANPASLPASTAWCAAFSPPLLGA